MVYQHCEFIRWSWRDWLDTVVKDARIAYICPVQKYDAKKNNSLEENPPSVNKILTLPRGRGRALLRMTGSECTRKEQDRALGSTKSALKELESALEPYGKMDRASGPIKHALQWARIGPRAL